FVLAVFHSYADHLLLHSFPTRRSSDLEAEALEVLFDAVEPETPGLDIVNAAVSGGGGANAQQALNARLQGGDPPDAWQLHPDGQDRKSTRLNSSHVSISYAVFCLKKKK